MGNQNIGGEVHCDEPILTGHMAALACRVYLNWSISLGKLAEYLETTVGQLKTVITSHGIDPFAAHYETSLGHS